MSPFQVFRLWARQAPWGERAVAGVAVALVVALTSWMVSAVDSGGGASGASTFAVSGAAPTGAAAAGTGDEATTAAAEGATDAPAVGSAGTASGPSSAGSADAPAASAAGGSGCQKPPSSAKGVTDTTIKVAVSLTNIGGPAANETFGGDPVDALRSDYEDVIESVNRAGGVACRKLVPQFFEANPADQSGLQKSCLDMVDAGVFAVLDQGSFADSSAISCFAQHKVPYFGSYILPQAVLDQGYPYLFEFGAYETIYRNAVLALRDRGFFNSANGFKKLGFVYRDCHQEVVDDFQRSLRDAGVPADQVVTYSVGCPATFANPSDIGQAVLKFRSAGVTNVTFAAFVGDLPSFTTVAEQQGFRPKYGFGDDSVIATSYSAFRANVDNFDGAVAIVPHRIGEDKTPGSVPSSGTVRCNAIYQAKGKPPVYQRRLGGGGRVCNNVGYFVAAASNVQTLTPEALAAGLQKAGSVDWSFPDGPNDFRGNRVTHGDEFWRVAQFVKGCTCWHVIDPTFHPSFR